MDKLIKKIIAFEATLILKPFLGRCFVRKRSSVCFAQWAEVHVTVNCERYRDMMNVFSCLSLGDIDVEHLWFQQDDAKCNAAKAIVNLFEGKFW